jgi:hypothetical protein
LMVAGKNVPGSSCESTFEIGCLPTEHPPLCRSLRVATAHLNHEGSKSGASPIKMASYGLASPRPDHFNSSKPLPKRSAFSLVGLLAT